jgi:hypothetical protein
LQTKSYSAFEKKLLKNNWIKKVKYTKREHKKNNYKTNGIKKNGTKKMNCDKTLAYNPFCKMCKH